MRNFLLSGAAVCALALGGCNAGGAAKPAAATPADATAFLKDAERQINDIAEYSSRSAWVNDNFITYDTD
ncbi:MAG: peptidase M2 family protein, partial [Alphaproteobacteria bacterium]